MTQRPTGQKSCLEYQRFYPCFSAIQYFYLWPIFLYSNSHVANYADDNTPYSAKKELMKILNDFEKDPGILQKWVKKNFFKK